MEHELESKVPYILERRNAHATFKSDVFTNLPANPIRHLQQTIGNHAVQLLIQAKLQVSEPGDRYEQEADHVARQVLSMPVAQMTPSSLHRQVLSEEEKDKAPTVQRKSLTESTTPLAQRQTIPEEEDKNKAAVQMKPLAASITPLVQRQAIPEEEKTEEQPLQKKVLAEPISPVAQRQAMPEEKEEQPVQMKALASVVQREALPEEEKDTAMQMKPALQPASQGGPGDAGSEIEHRLARSRGTGNPLPDYVRGFMEPRFGTDFSGVRVHTGHEAVQMSQALNAQAFTVGQDVYYGPGKSPSDLALTAHELTHVVQQTGAVQTKLQRACPTCAAGGPPCPTCQSEQ